jgi:hypothetical protein
MKFTLEQLEEIAQGEIQGFMNVTYVEIEDETSIRVDDNRDNSIWLYTDGTYNGEGLKPQFRAWLKEKGLTKITI